MYKEKIARKSALFYQNWAQFRHQTEKDTSFAVKILKSGLKKGAQPQHIITEYLAKISDDSTSHCGPG
jgi:hypothetical protein